MHLTMAPFLFWAGLVSTTLLSFVAAEANFYDVRTHLNRDHSRQQVSPLKYFRESNFHPHYDGRFADRRIDDANRSTVLKNMVKTFLATMSDIGAETWIMHGTLLGWWWNQQVLPWDDDFDFMVDYPTIEFLAKYFNMTEYHYELPGGTVGTYLLEVNPNYIYGTVEDVYNKIDARWIDTNSGLFIDISTIRPDLMRRAQGLEGAMIVKDRHHYMYTDIFPLRDSFFEGVHVKVPFEYETLLEEEYGEKCFTATVYEGHRWNDTTKLWEPIFALGTEDERHRHGARPHAAQSDQRPSHHPPHG